MINKEHVPYIWRKTNQLRYEICKESLLFFAKSYLGHIFELPPSLMHKETASLLQMATIQRNNRLAIAEPYGYGLSNLVSIGYILWSICYEYETFILIVSSSKQQGSEILEAVKNELKTNPYLLNDFPEIAGKSKRHWQNNSIITRNKIKIATCRLNQRTYVNRHLGKRPSLMVFDNIDEGVEILKKKVVKKRVEKAKDMANKSIDPRGNIIAIGTMICDAMLTDIINMKNWPGWTCKKYQAVLKWATNEKLWQKWKSIYRCDSVYYYDYGSKVARKFFEDHKEAMTEGSAVLWPEHEDYCTLMDQKVSIGKEKFDAEKQNEPYYPYDSKINRARQMIRALEAEAEAEAERKRRAR